MRNVIAAVFSVFVFGVASIAQNSLTPQPNTVLVGADGKFETAPDTALIQFNISANADNPKGAYDRAAKQAEAGTLRPPSRRTPELNVRMERGPTGKGRSHRHTCGPTLGVRGRARSLRTARTRP